MSKRSKDTISKAFLNLLENNNICEITISKICENTNLVRKTFYNNFKTKEEVLIYITKELINNYDSLIKQESSLTLNKAVNLFFKFGKENINILKVIINNNLFSVFLDEFNIYFSLLVKNIQLNKEILTDDMNQKYINIFNSAGLTNLLKQWILNDFDKSEEEMTNLYIKLSSSYLK